MSPTSYNKKNSITVDKQVVEKTITFLTTNGTLEKKPNGDKNSFQVKDQANWHQMTLLIILQHHQKP